tara:strand:+ start:817 stop:1104 length:288 start_codon:yes stop_codon:yes gene_type:complete
MATPNKIGLDLEPKLSYERYLQTIMQSYTSWLQDMYLDNTKEREQQKEAPFITAESYEWHHYDYLQDRYINFCIAQYNLYYNDGEMDIEITLFDA